jgi:hypothetical protein
MDTRFAGPNTALPEEFEAEFEAGQIVPVLLIGTKRDMVAAAPSPLDLEASMRNAPIHVVSIPRCFFFVHDLLLLLPFA